MPLAAVQRRLVHICRLFAAPDAPSYARPGLDRRLLPRFAPPAGMPPSPAWRRPQPCQRACCPQPLPPSPAAPLPRILAPLHMRRPGTHPQQLGPSVCARVLAGARGTSQQQHVRLRALPYSKHLSASLDPILPARAGSCVRTVPIHVWPFPGHPPAPRRPIRCSSTLHAGYWRQRQANCQVSCDARVQGSLTDAWTQRVASATRKHRRRLRLGAPESGVVCIAGTPLSLTDTRNAPSIGPSFHQTVIRGNRGGLEGHSRPAALESRPAGHGSSERTLDSLA